MERLALGLLVFIFTVTRLGAQSCTSRIDLRWIDTPPETFSHPVSPAPGVVLTPQSAQIAANFLGARLGPIYWKEAAKRYPDICLDAPRADYFVFWNGTGGTTNVFVFPRRESGCVVSKELFTTEKTNRDPERSAKDAFRDVLAFLRTNGKSDYSSVPGCMEPDKIEHLWKSVRASEDSADQPKSSPKDSSASDDSAKSLLEISSIPQGADIELDGHFIGNTPSSVSVPVGEHSLRMTRNGYKRWERSINALSGKVSINAELQAEAQ
jgi:hypothetical protein